MKKIPYTHWPSELTPESFAQSSARKGEIQCDECAVYWLQQLPQESGRQVIMRWDGKNPAQNISPEKTDIGNRVNEYGGGSYYPLNDAMFFSNRINNQFYKNDKPLTSGDLALAAPTLTSDKRFVIMVAEKKGNPVKQSLVAIDTQTNQTTTLENKLDFYGNPRLNQKNQLAYITWQMPHMPWEHSTIKIASFDSQQLTLNYQDEIDLPGYQSQPTWHNDTLYFISDHETGFGQLYCYHDHKIRNVCDNWPDQADMSIPMWNLAQQTFAIIDEETIAIIFAKLGRHTLGVIKNGVLTVLDLPYITYGDHMVYWKGKLVFLGATAFESIAIVAYDLTSKKTEIISQMSEDSLLRDDISAANAIYFPTRDGAMAHAFYYPPKHHEYTGLPNTLPPLLVLNHGGPTSSTHGGFAQKIQFWTNRGFAVVDVNYRGSTGFGRDYWQALQHQWGVVDVIDAVSAADYCVSQGWVNPDQLFIRGNSAGGFLTLNAITHYDIFTAAAVYYGIADLTAFLNFTHRFEEGYNAWLLGPYPEQKQLYIDRSPITHIDKLKTPVIFFHGLEDTVVSTSQSEAMYLALKEKGIPTEYATFPNEGHGFRSAQTLIRSLEMELEFYRMRLR